MKRLEQLLRETDHKSYPAYKSLKGKYAFAGYVLSIDHVQGDPFAAQGVTAYLYELIKILNIFVKVYGHLFLHRRSGK